MPHRPLDLVRLLEICHRRRPATELAAEVLADRAERCDECAEALEQARRVSRQQDQAVDYGPAFAAARERAARAAALLADERPDADRDLARLRALAAGRRLAAVEAARRRYQSPWLVDLLVAEARRTVRRDPAEALELAECAAVVARRVPIPTFGRPFADRLLLRAEAHRANALRVAGELPSADAVWLELHRREQDEPLGDADLEAELRSLEASLRLDQRRLDEAEVLLRDAEVLYRECNDRQGVARVLIQQGNTALYAGEPETAIGRFGEAGAMLDPGRSPELSLMAQNNLGLALCDLGRFAQAQRVVEGCRALDARCKDRWSRARLRWLEGRIARGRGDLGPAEELLLAVRNDYLAQALPFDAAMVSLDLAELYLLQGRTGEVRRLAGAMVESFVARGIEREALAAMTLFHEAACAEQVTKAWLSALRRYLAQGPASHRREFQPPSMD